MLAKKFRLPIQFFTGKRGLAAGKRGRLVRTPCFLMKIYPLSVEAPRNSRFGVTVSAKTAKKAVDRNRLKRSVYNFLRNQRGIPLNDYWITILAPAARLPKAEFIRELSKLLHG